MTQIYILLVFIPRVEEIVKEVRECVARLDELVIVLSAVSQVSPISDRHLHVC